MADDSSSEDDIPIGQLKKKTPKKEPDADVVSSSAAAASSSDKKPAARKRPTYKEDSDFAEDDSDDDFAAASPPPAKKKKKSSSSSTKTKVKKEKAVKKEKKAPKKKSSTTKAEKPKPKKKPAAASKKKSSTKALKKQDKVERISHAMQAYLWWNGENPPKGCQWSKMEHAGVSFPEPYVPHGVKMLYDGEEVDLKPHEEEAANFYAGMDPEGMHLGDPKIAPTFIKNFFTDFKAILGKKHQIKDFKKCDFSPIKRHLDEQKVVNKAITDSERQRNKEIKNATMFKFGYALVDGHLEKVGNYNMEPPSAFRGRGLHPKCGKLKQRVIPEQVMINVSECAPVPRASVDGHAWSEVRHDPSVQWLCTWTENINNQNKYMSLAAQSSFKGKSDRSKYNKAAKLCGNIDKIRKDYKKNLKSKDNATRQLATAMWVIDRLALRVGGEKNTEEEADTVGCCSLRVEHLKFDPNNEGEGNLEIELEFLGKDSMLFKQTIDFGSALYTEDNGMGEQVYKNFETFCKKKKPSDQVFSDLEPSDLNAHFKSIMDGLSAKVFRTYNASKTLQDELLKTEETAGWKRLTATEKVVEYNNANREVAILCNHQKTVSKAQEATLDGLGDKLQTLKDQKKQLKKHLKYVLAGDESKVKLLTKKPAKLQEQANEALEKAKKMKEKAKTKEEKIAATEKDLAAKALKKEAADAKYQAAHLTAKVPNQTALGKKIETWNDKIKKMELNIKHKDDNKEVSLGTSKLNYMDPRISVAFCKRNEVPIEKVFSKTMRDKFNWAMAVPPRWEFNEKVAKVEEEDN